MVQTYRGREALPVYGHVRLDAMDPAAEREAQELLRDVVGFGAEVVGYRQQESFTRLAEAVATELFDGTARNGLELNSLTRGRTASGRIRAAFNEQLRSVVDIAVRALLYLFNVPALHEYITSLPFRTGDEMNGFGVDHLPGLSRIAHGLFAGVAAPDRVLYAQGSWLPASTVADHSSPRFDAKRTAGWEQELARKLPGPIHESLEQLFEDELRAKRATLAAARRSCPAFERLKIDPIRFLKGYFPDCVIVDTLPYGPPEVHGASSEGIFYPGDDEQAVSVIAAAGRYGIARCDLDVPIADINDVETSLLPELSERFGEAPTLISPQLLEQVVKWPRAQQGGIGPEVRFVRYWRFEGTKYVVRAAQLSGREGEQVNDVTVWRAIGLDNTLQREMVALLERAAQSWPWGCINRMREECQPGKVQAWAAASRDGLLKTLLASNAALVSAHRAMEVRRLSNLEHRQ